MKKDGIFIRLNSEDRKNVDRLKKEHSVNISQLFRNVVKDYCKDLDENKKRPKEI